MRSFEIYIKKLSNWEETWNGRRRFDVRINYREVRNRISGFSFGTQIQMKPLLSGNEWVWRGWTEQGDWYT